MHGSACRRHGERNSMNDGRRQLEPPKQLLQPGLAARPSTTSERHAMRDDDMKGLLRRWRARTGRDEVWRRRRRRHENPSPRSGAGSRTWEFFGAVVTGGCAAGGGCVDSIDDAAADVRG
jgi:hypothetical protein